MAKRNGNGSTRDMVVALNERFDIHIQGPTGLLKRMESLEAEVHATNTLLKDGIRPLVVDKISKDLYGDSSAEDVDEKKGIIVRFDDHEANHKKINAAILGMLGTLGVAVVSMWRDILKGLGIIK